MINLFKASKLRTKETLLQSLPQIFESLKTVKEMRVIFIEFLFKKQSIINKKSWKFEKVLKTYFCHFNFLFSKYLWESNKIEPFNVFNSYFRSNIQNNFYKLSTSLSFCLILSIQNAVF